MLKRFIGTGLSKPKNPHSLEYLKYLHGVLVKNISVTEYNKKLLVECLRAIAEILIWGDQNDSTVFDFFLERQMLSYFLSIMAQDCGTYICVQLLQTLNILFENIRHKTSLYYLLSNNHVNSIILHKFDFTNEEIMAYYISFLKTLSFKLNAYTIHFFFNEASQEFPLYTEAVKFNASSEPMVRIAVRTTTLNIYKVEDEAMRSFVRERSRDHLCSLIDLIATQSIDIDHFARSAENECSNRERLAQMIDNYLDHVHYMNDIFLIKDEKLSAMLNELLFERLLAPLYLASLGELHLNPSAAHLTPISSLFFLTQFVLIVDDTEVVRALLSSFFFGDNTEVHYQWIREQDNSWTLTNVFTVEKIPRPFLDGYLSSLKCSRNDHTAFFGLLFIYAVCRNTGVQKEILTAVNFTCDVTDPNESNLFHALLDVIERSISKEAQVRTVTVDLCCIVIRQLLLAMDASQLTHNECQNKVEAVKALVVKELTPAVHSEELFLEMFEDEYHYLERNKLKLSVISGDAALLLPPPSTPMSGVSLDKRLPCGSEEKVRQKIQLFFHLRRFILDLRCEEEKYLPLFLKSDVIVEVNDCINLENSDLLACTVCTNAKSLERVQKFLVTDQQQLILVEPDLKRMGWAIVRFVGLLQDTQLSGDLNDSRALQVVVSDVSSRSRANCAPLLNAKLIFDDHIRCMAAKQRLTKGRNAARQRKLDVICDLLGIARCSSSASASSHNPFRVIKGCAPGSLRKHHLISATSSGRNTANSRSSSRTNLSSSNSSLNIVPDDPVQGCTSQSPSPSPSTSNKRWRIENV